MGSTQEKVEKLAEKLRQVNRKAQKFTAPRQNLMELKLIEMDDLKMLKNFYWDCPYHVDLTDIWWFYWN